MTEPAQGSKPIGYLPFAFLCVLAFWSFFQAQNLVEKYSQGRLSVVTEESGRKFVSDFVHFYVAGTIAGSPQSHQIYDWDVQEKVFRRVVGFDVTKSEFYTQYMPQVFTMMVPIACIPLNTAHILWDFFTLLFGAVTFFFFARSAGERSRRLAAIVLLLAVACYPAWQSLINGQLSWLLLGLFSAYFICLLRGRPILAGLSLALCAIKPQYLLFALLPLVFAKRFKTLFATVAFTVLVLAIAVVNVGIDSFLVYPQALHEVEATVKSVAPNAMPCVRGLLSIFLSQEKALSISGALSLMALLMIAIIFKMKSASFSTERGFLAANALAIMTSLFFSAHTHAYDCLLIGLAGVLFLSAADRENRFYKQIRGSFVAYPILSWFFFFCGAFTDSQIGMQFLAVFNIVLLALVLVWFLKTDWEKAAAAPSIE